MAAARSSDGRAELPPEVGWTPDLIKARDSASPTWDGGIGVKYHFHTYVGPTRTFLEQPAVWLAITRAAAALLRHPRLSGSEVEAIVEDAGVEPDRLPVASVSLLAVVSHGSRRLPAAFIQGAHRCHQPRS